MRKSLCFFVCLLTLILVDAKVLALTDPLIVTVENDTVSVVDEDSNPIEDFSNNLSYTNGKLTIKEGTLIKKLIYADDIEITSDDLEVVLGKVERKEYGTEVKHVKINHLISAKNDISFYGTSQYIFYEIYDSTINNFQLLWGGDTGDGVTIKRSSIKYYNDDTSYGELYFDGPLTIEDSDYKGPAFHSEYDSVYIKNCTYLTSGSIVTEGTNGVLQITNSTIAPAFNNGYINITDYSHNYDDPTLIIDNSKLNTVIIQMSNNKNKITNSTINVKENNSTDFSNSIIDNTTINLNGNSSLRLYGNIFNSSINNAKDLSFYKDSIIDNTKMNALSSIFLMKDIQFKNSYIKIISDGSVSSYYEGLLTVVNSLNTVDTYMYLKDEGANKPVIYGAENSTITFDRDVYDLDGNKLYQVKDTNNTIYYSKASTGETKTKSLVMTYDVKVTFKIKNGTWADGTTEDIVVTLESWNSLNESQIPSGLKQGKWDLKPNTTDLITKDMVYTYTIDKIDNPKTGVINTIIYLLPITLLIFALYYSIKMSLFKKM